MLASLRLRSLATSMVGPLSATHDLPHRRHCGLSIDLEPTRSGSFVLGLCCRLAVKRVLVFSGVSQRERMDVRSLLARNERVGVLNAPPYFFADRAKGDGLLVGDSGHRIQVGFHTVACSAHAFFLRAGLCVEELGVAPRRSGHRPHGTQSLSQFLMA